MIDAAAPAAPLKEPASARLEELRKVAQGFESIFMQMLFRSMRSTVQESKLFHGGRGEEVFRDILDRHLVGGGSGKGLGIADMIVGRYGALVKEAGDAGKGTRIDLRVGT